jgi:hypothetical protein
LYLSSSNNIEKKNKVKQDQQNAFRKEKFPFPSYLHQFQNACTSASTGQQPSISNKKKTPKELGSQRTNAITNLDCMLGHMLATLALQPQHNLLGSLSLWSEN